MPKLNVTFGVRSHSVASGDLQQTLVDVPVVADRVVENAIMEQTGAKRQDVYIHSYKDAT